MMKIALLLLCTTWVASGFVVLTTTTSSRPSSSTPTTRLLKQLKHQPAAPALSVGGVVVMETEDDARFILSKAKECAYGDDDSCDLQDCEVLLHEMLHMQSGCVTGTLIGHDLCDEQDIAADVVAHLREKIKEKKKVLTKRYVHESYVST
jgi:hypothetical protein